MSDMPRVKCPEYVSGACLGQGCDGFLQDVAFAGLAQDGRNHYSGTCRRGGRWEHFTVLFAEPAPSKVRPGLSAYDGRRKAMPTVGRAVLPVPSVCGFTAEDRRMLRQIHRASVFGETPTDAQVAGDVRRRQVLYGAKLYSRPTKYEKGLSAAKAAEKAIRAPQFRDVEGAYTLAEKSSLARAIIREHGSPRPDSAT